MRNFKKIDLFLMMKCKGFTLVEIMILVTIIGLLIAIAVPSFYSARDGSRKSLCENNIRIIGQAVEQYKVTNNLDTDEDPSFDDNTLGGYFKNAVIPSCPSSGTYTLTDGIVACDAEGHTTTYDTVT